MEQRPVPPAPLIPPAVLAWLRKPQFLIPIAVVVGMTIIAFGVQPSGAKGETPALGRATATPVSALATSTPVATNVPTKASGTTPAASGTQRANGSNQQPGNGNGTTGNGNGQTPQGTQPGGTTVPTSDVAGVRGTPSATATQPAPDLSTQSTQCGAIQESSTALAIEQSLNGVSVKATKATVYPIEYFRCILMATGGQEAYSLAGAVQRAQTNGMTHAVLIDLWVTNAGKNFGQVTMKDAQLALAGQVFGPLATLGGRAEIVVSSGQGRNVTLVVAVKNTVGATTGPMTLTIGAPFFGGQAMQGKYSLFLPTP